MSTHAWEVMYANYAKQFVDRLRMKSCATCRLRNQHIISKFDSVANVLVRKDAIDRCMFFLRRDVSIFSNEWTEIQKAGATCRYYEQGDAIAIDPLAEDWDIDERIAKWRQQFVKPGDEKRAATSGAKAKPPDKPTLEELIKMMDIDDTNPYMRAAKMRLMQAAVNQGAIPPREFNFNMPKRKP